MKYIAVTFGADLVLPHMYVNLIFLLFLQKYIYISMCVHITNKYIQKKFISVKQNKNIIYVWKIFEVVKLVLVHFFKCWIHADKNKEFN